MSVWGWPQWAVLVAIFIVVIGTAIPPEKEYGTWNVILWCVFSWVLWMGGFWS